jgi:hypothetical protein
MWRSRLSAAHMFCPNCHAEYRQGFIRCADCEVELVAELPNAAMVPRGRSEPDEAGGVNENPEDPFCEFWKGEDPRIHAEICELLDQEGVPHKTVRREDHLFHLSAKSAFRIGIPSIGPRRRFRKLTDRKMALLSN